MPFPQAQRVIYGKNPLSRVVCQLRFPTILKIDSELPVIFQERIRTEFPDFVIREDPSFGFIPQMVPDMPLEFLRQLTSSATKNYEFQSEDGIWTLNLTPKFMSLSTKNYTRWEDFKSKLINPFSALKDIYKLPYISRSGLRYIDIICRSKLNLINVDWNELLQPYALGLLSSNDNIRKNTKNFEAKYEIGLADNNSKVRIIMGFVQQGEKEQCFKVDADFFNEQNTGVDQVTEMLDYLHGDASRLIQWVIKPQLHDAMEPREYA